MISDKELIAVSKIRNFVVVNINSMNLFKLQITERLIGIDDDRHHPAVKEMEHKIKDLNYAFHGICGALSSAEEILKFIDNEALLEDE